MELLYLLLVMLRGKLYCGFPVCDTVRFGLLLKSVQGSAQPLY